MRFAGPLFALLFAAGIHAAPYIDPTAIEADAPEMLQPSAIHSFCGPRGFAISVDPVQIGHGKSEGEALTYPLDEQGGTKTIECKQNDSRIVATLRIAPPGGNGFCGAVHYVHLKLQVDDQILLATKFAEYCSPWGLTSLSLLGHGGAFPPTLRMCGYWRESVPVTGSQLKVDKRSFECADFSAAELLEKKLVLSDGPHEINVLNP